MRPIQYLRGVAALMVVWHHALTQIPNTSRYLEAHWGASGVDLFFVISGFIMAGITHGRDQRPWDFMGRRIVRVVPLYWFVTLSMVALALAAPSLFKTLKVEGDTLLMSLFFIPHFSSGYPTEVWPLLFPGWTLNYEMFFYAVFAASLVLPKSWRTGALVLTMVSLVVFGGSLQGDSAFLRVYTSPLLLEFSAGVLIGHAWASGHLTMPWQVSASCMAVGAALLVLRDAPPLMFLTQLLGASLVVVGALNPLFDRKPLPRLQLIGDASYSIYLTHLFALGGTRVVWLKIHPGEPSLLSSWAYVLLAMLAATVGGVLVYWLVERPLLHWLQPRRSKALATGAAPA